MYISLLQLSPPPSEVLLKAALLRRATADVQRIIAFREDKTALQALLQKGCIDDELWNAFLAAEKELEAEIVEVVNEANSFREGWGQFIFNSASEVVNNIKQRDIVLSAPKMRADAEAKYGGLRKAPKSVIPVLSVPSPQSSAPASPRFKNTVLNGRVTPSRSATPNTSTTAAASPVMSVKSELDNASSAGTPPPSTNGDAAGPSSSPRSKPSKTPGSASKSRKRK